MDSPVESEVSLGNILIKKVGEAGFPDRRDYDWYSKGPRELEFQGEKGQKLSILGIAHSRNPDDAINKGIREKIINYTREPLDKSKQIVFVEGFHSGIPENLKQEWLNSSHPDLDYIKIVKQEAGEMHGAAFLATRSGVEVVSPEVSQVLIINKLKLAGIQPDQIILNYFLRDVGNFSLDNQSILKLQIVKQLYDLSITSEANWTSKLTDQEKLQVAQNPDQLFNILLPKINEVATREIGTPIFSVDTDGNIKLEVTVDRTKQLTSPYYNQNYEALNKITRIDHYERDKYLIVQIQKAMDEGKSPLVIFGDSHITAIEPALQKKFKEARRD